MFVSEVGPMIFNDFLLLAIKSLCMCWQGFDPRWPWLAVRCDASVFPLPVETWWINVLAQSTEIVLGSTQASFRFLWRPLGSASWRRDSTETAPGGGWTVSRSRTCGIAFWTRDELCYKRPRRCGRAQTLITFTTFRDWGHPRGLCKNSSLIVSSFVVAVPDLQHYHINRSLVLSGWLPLILIDRGVGTEISYCRQ